MAIFTDTEEKRYSEHKTQTRFLHSGVDSEHLTGDRTSIIGLMLLKDVPNSVQYLDKVSYSFPDIVDEPRDYVTRETKLAGSFGDYGTLSDILKAVKQSIAKVERLLRDEIPYSDKEEIQADVILELWQGFHMQGVEYARPYSSLAHLTHSKARRICLKWLRDKYTKQGWEFNPISDKWKRITVLRQGELTDKILKALADEAFDTLLDSFDDFITIGAGKIARRKLAQVVEKVIRYIPALDKVRTPSVIASLCGFKSAEALRVFLLAE